MSITAPQPAKVAPEKNHDDIEILAILLTLLRGWKLIIICATLGLLLGVLYSRYASPVFKTDALLQIDGKSQGISALGSNISELVTPYVSSAQTENALIKSRMVLEPVVNALHLDIQLTDPEVKALDKIVAGKTATQNNTSDGVTLDTVDGLTEIQAFEVPLVFLNKSFTLKRSDAGFIFSDGSNDFKGQLGEPATFKTREGDIDITVSMLPVNGHPITITKRSLQNTADALNSTLTVSELGNQTGIIQLSLTGDNQEQISRVLTEVVKSYVNQNQARGSEQTTTTLKFMESQIPKLKKDLEAAEAKFNEFRTTYGIIDVSKEAELLLAESSNIETQLNELNLKLAELGTYYTEEHPSVIQINDQINVLLKRKQEIKQTISEMPEVQRESLQLSADMEISREIYLAMLKNYEQLKIVKAGEIGYVRVIDMPINTYRAIAPKKTLIQGLGLLSGLLLGTLLVFLKSLLRNTIKDPERLEAKTGVPVIATVPASKAMQRLSNNKKATRRLLAHIEPDGVSYEAIKSLRTFLMFGMPKASKREGQGRVILITGESPGIGKSFITANLAEAFSDLGKRILVIDADMRLGHLHNVFTVNEDIGLNEYLTISKPLLPTALNQTVGGVLPQTDVKDYIHSTSLDYIDFMPRGRQPRNPAALLASDRFAEMMTQLTTQYDYIFIDSPPVLAASDAIITSQYADKVLMVTRYDQSIEGQLTYAIKQMRKANIEVDGIVLNAVRQGITDKYSYHYNYSYGHNDNK